MYKKNIVKIVITLTTLFLFILTSVIPVAGEPECQPYFTGIFGDNNWYITDVELGFYVDKLIVEKVWYSITNDPDPVWIPFPIDDVVTLSEEGDHTFRYKWKLKDDPHHRNGSQFYTLKIDKTPPTIKITKRVKQLDRQLIITGNPKDEESKVRSVEFYLDDIWQETDTNHPYEYIFSWEKGEPIGDHVVKAIVYDNAGFSNNASTTPVNYPHHGVFMNKIIQRIYSIRQLFLQVFNILMSFPSYL